MTNPRCTHYAGICDHLVCDKETTMTITDSIARPTTTRALCSDATFLAAHDAVTLHGLPTWVSHPTLEAIITAMRAEGRNELVHYAGASYRDAIAWQVCVAWLADPTQPESVLKSRSLAVAAPAWALSPEDIRAANPGMR